jgi:hypothetical protein
MKINLRINYLLHIKIAAIMPGTQPHKVSTHTNNIEPHPLSNTANGGKIRHTIARKSDMSIKFSANLHK